MGRSSAAPAWDPTGRDGAPTSRRRASWSIPEQGRGIGRALGVEALRWAREQGFHGMQFNAVVETNVAAVRLWQALGFEIMTTIPEAFEHTRHGTVGLHVMYQRLGEEPNDALSGRLGDPSATRSRLSTS
jgi:hypothetical protein